MFETPNQVMHFQGSFVSSVPSGPFRSSSRVSNRDELETLEQVHVGTWSIDLRPARLVGSMLLFQYIQRDARYHELSEQAFMCLRDLLLEREASIGDIEAVFGDVEELIRLMEGYNQEEFDRRVAKNGGNHIGVPFTNLWAFSRKDDTHDYRINWLRRNDFMSTASPSRSRCRRRSH